MGELVPDHWPTGTQVFRTIRVTIALVILLGTLTLIGLAFNITLWDWLELLIVPAALAIGGFWLNRAQREREREAQEAQRQRELELEDTVRYMLSISRRGPARLPVPARSPELGRLPATW